MDAVKGIGSVWLHLPADVRARVSQELGAPAVEFQAAAGGFSDGVVGIVTITKTRVFMKAVPTQSAAAADYRIEAAVSHALPAAVPSPRLRFFFEQHGWVLLCFDAIDGLHPREPWRTSELRSVSNTLDAIGSALPSFDTRDLPTVADRMHGRCLTWTALAEVGSHGRLGIQDLTPWERHNLDRLAQIEASWHRHLVGGQLLHFDLRFDNIMLAPTGAVWFLDWGRACIGPGWVDLVCLLLESDLGPIDPETAFLASTLGQSADPAAVDAFLVALASNWRHSASLPPPAHALHLQSRRIRSRDQTLDWLGRRWL